MKFEYFVEDPVVSVCICSLETAASSAMTIRVEESLRTSGYLALRKVRVRPIPAGVQLCGKVTTYHMKQLAQAAALRVFGVRVVRNELEVIA